MSQLSLLNRTLESRAAYWLYQIKINIKAGNSNEAVKAYLSMSGLTDLLEVEDSGLSESTKLELSMLDEKAIKILKAEPCDECNGEDSYCDFCRGLGYRWPED